MNLLMRGHSSNSDYDADLGYVFVEMTPTLARLILRRMAAFKAMKKKDRRAVEAYFWDGSAVYLRHEQVAERLAAEVNSDLLIETKKHIDYRDGANVECDQMVVGEATVHFTAFPKHSDIYITSEAIPEATIRAALKTKKRKA